jgi:DNA-binding phage protein
MRVLELADVIAMLRSEVKRIGGQVAWAKKARVDRAIVSKVLNGHRPPNKAITKALKLRMVFVSQSRPPQSKQPIPY